MGLNFIAALFALVLIGVLFSVIVHMDNRLDALEQQGEGNAVKLDIGDGDDAFLDADMELLYTTHGYNAYFIETGSGYKYEIRDAQGNLVAWTE